jgi:hypothetical protein
MAYIGVSPQNGVRKKHTYTASGSQTDFTGAGAEGITLSYKDSNFVDVYQNGVKLAEADYTSTSGTTIVLEQAAAANDIVEIIVYDVFSTSDMVSASDGGTFAGNVAMSGNLDVDGTLEADAMTLNGTTITTVATLSTGISNGNLPVFTSGVVDDDFLRINGTSVEGRSASEVLSDIGGQAALTFGISNTNIPIFTSGVADDDFLRVNGTSIEGRSASEVLSDIGAAPSAGSSNIVTTGALDSGSITSGFGNINNGTSTLTTGNSDINGTLNVQGETTLQTHLNMGDNDIIKLGDSGDLEIYHDSSNSQIINSVGHLNIDNNGDDKQINLRSDDGSGGITNYIRVNGNTGAVQLYHYGSTKLATSSTGVDITGGFTATDGCTITTADNNPQITLVSTDTDASLGPELRLYRNSSSPADSDAIGQIKFNGQNSNGDPAVYAEIDAAMTDVTDGTEDGQLRLLISKDGTLRQALSLNSTTIIVNDAGQDVDFRVEGSGNSNLIRTDAANDRVGIGINPDTTILTVNGQVGTTNGSASAPTHTFYSDADTGMLRSAANTLGFATGGSERSRYDSSGNLTIGAAGSSISAPNPAVIIKPSGVINMGNNSGSNGTNFIELRRNGTQIGAVQQSGTTGIAYQTSSDYRLKENVAYNFDATTRLKQLKPCRFNFIAEADRTVDGFLAHEVSSVVPEAINGEKDAMTAEVLYVDGDEIPDDKKVGDVKEASTIDPQQIDQSKLVPLLTKALQEQQATIEALTARIVTLENA